MTDDTEHRIGLLTDLHYDGTAQAMNRLYEAAASLNQAGAEALVVMGDLINGTSETNALRLLREVSALCESFHRPIHYLPGNHDLDHISKAQFYAALGRKGSEPHFRFFAGGYDFIGLDGNFSPDGRAYEKGNFKWREAAVSDTELNWLREQLAEASERVILISHQRIDKPCIHAVQNHDAVEKVLATSGKVKAVFQGHNHEEDLIRLDDIACYTLAAHVDGAGPGIVRLKPQGVYLLRDPAGLKRIEV